MAKDKKELVDNLVWELLNNVPDNKQQIKKLLQEALEKKSIKELENYEL